MNIFNFLTPDSQSKPRRGNFFFFSFAASKPNHLMHYSPAIAYSNSKPAIAGDMLFESGQLPSPMLPAIWLKAFVIVYWFEKFGH